MVIQSAVPHRRVLNPRWLLFLQTMLWLLYITLPAIRDAHALRQDMQVDAFRLQRSVVTRICDIDLRHQELQTCLENIRHCGEPEWIL